MTNILYHGYRDDWHDNTKYPFDEYKCNDEDVFDFVPKVRNVELKCIPNDTILVNITSDQQGWTVCHYQSIKKQPPAPAPINNLVQFSNSQPAYISQYYAHIKCKIPEAEVYQAIKNNKEDNFGN